MLPWQVHFDAAGEGDIVTRAKHQPGLVLPGVFVMFESREALHVQAGQVSTRLIVEDFLLQFAQFLLEGGLVDALSQLLVVFFHR